MYKPFENMTFIDSKFLHFNQLLYVFKYFYEYICQIQVLKGKLKETLMSVVYKKISNLA